MTSQISNNHNKTSTGSFYKIMGINKKQSGLTLIDALFAVTIIAALTTIVLTIATSIQNKAAQQKCEGTLATINTALQQYKEFGYDFPLSSDMDNDEITFYRSLQFPPDCNEYQLGDVVLLIQDLFDNEDVEVDIDDVSKYLDPNGVMYFFLNRIPQCRETLKKIDPKYVVCTQDINGDYQSITITNSGGGSRTYPWERIVDPWGNTFMYDYYVNEQEYSYSATTKYKDMGETIRNFPLVTSAGPDEIFNTPDDITNREKTRTPIQK